MTKAEFEKLIDAEQSAHSFPDDSTEQAWTMGLYDGAEFAWQFIERLEKENQVLRDAIKTAGTWFEEYGGDKELEEALAQADRIRKGEA